MIMNAKSYLQQISKIDVMINNKIAEMDHWKAVATSSTVSTEGERVKSSGSKEKMADAVCRYLTIESEINADIDRLINTKQDIIKTIEKLKIAEYDVLHKRYVQFKDLYNIADEMGKSYSWVTTIHGKALADLQKILNEREQL